MKWHISIFMVHCIETHVKAIGTMQWFAAASVLMNVLLNVLLRARPRSSIARPPSEAKLKDKHTRRRKIKNDLAQAKTRYT